MNKIYSLAYVIAGLLGGLYSLFVFYALPNPSIGWGNAEDIPRDLIIGISVLTLSVSYLFLKRTKYSDWSLALCYLYFILPFLSGFFPLSWHFPDPAYFGPSSFDYALEYIGYAALALSVCLLVFGFIKGRSKPENTVS